MTRRLVRAGIAALLLCLAAPAVAKEPSERLKELQEVGTTQYRAGATRAALATAREVLALTIEEFGPNDEKTGIQTYGVAFLAEAVGDWPLAERYYRETVRIRDAVYGVDSPASTMAMERLGAVLIKTGRPAEAEPLFERVVTLRKDLLGEHAFSATAYAGLADARFARGDTSAALPLYRKAVTLLTTQNTAQALAQLTTENDIKSKRDVFIGLSRAVSAERRRSGDSAALTDESFTAGQLAWATSAASALTKMTARLKAGETELGRAMRTLQTLTDRIVALHEEDTKAITERLKVQQADPAYSAALEAFQKVSVEQSRVNAPAIKRQRELIDKFQALLARCPPGEAKAGCASSDKDREAITAEMGRLATETSKGSGKIMELSNALQAADARLPGHAAFEAARNARLAESQRLETERTAHRAAIVAKFPDYMSLSEPRPLSIAAVQALLGADEALVAMLTGSERGFVWVVTRERTEWAEVDAGEAALSADVTALRRGLDPFLIEDDAQKGITSGFDLARAHKLYTLLLEPFARTLAGKRHLILVPTGPLTSLPFQVLLTAPPPDATGGEAMRAAQWLIRRHALSVLPSVQSLSALRKLAGNGAAPNPFFGMGDPVLTGPPPSPAEKRGAARMAGVQRAGLYRNGLADVRLLRQLEPLPDTADELRAVALTLRAPPSAVSLREAATEARLKATPLNYYRVLHFATHGLVAGDLDGVDEPALVLTPPAVATEADDGLLTASEIATLRLDADWVVLSACNTAAGGTVGADALSGLARAFFFAGARAMLVSHWSVYSQAAVQLTTRTFANLSADRGMGRAEAFRRAMLTVIDEGQPPAYWAPFVVVGEGGTASVGGVGARGAVGGVGGAGGTGPAR